MSPFALDRYEVTYSRFRKFLEAYDSLPPARQGEGRHPKIPGSGWQEEWNSNIALSDSRFALENELSLCGEWRAKDMQDMPVRCVNWYVAQRFCIWDHARLPTEAEWTFAAAGGTDAREYPWDGPTGAPIDESRACYTEELPQKAGPSPVGRHSAGEGKYGHEDLAGNVAEWVADWYWQRISDGRCVEANSSTARRATTSDCLELTPSDTRVLKGGAFLNFPEQLTTFARAGGYPARNAAYAGFRCARDPK